MKRIIITGNIAAGKSAVVKIIKSRGYEVFDADDVAHRALDDLVVKRAFAGLDVFNDEGNIDRAKMAQLAFDDKKQRQHLENLVHPIVWAQLSDYWLEQSDDGKALAFADVPLLFESAAADTHDVSILIYADDGLRQQRLMKNRQMSKSEALKRMNSQMPQTDKLALADYVIINNGSKKDLEKQVENILSRLSASGEKTRSAIYAGSFDPITKGHEDVIRQALKAFEELKIIVATNSEKNASYTFSSAERAQIIRQVVAPYGAKVEVVELPDEFIAEYAKRNNIKSLVRGIRSAKDYSEEIVNATANRIIYPELDTFFTLPSVGGQEVVSSSLVKNVIYGVGNWQEVMLKFAPPATVEAFRRKQSQSAKK
jgi:dephospho-CoA kinase